MPFIHVRLSQNHMATTFDFRVRCEPRQEAMARQTLEEAHRLVHRLESELSEFLPESPISQLNHAEPHNWVTLTQSGEWVLKESLEIEKLSQGAFSCLAKSDRHSSRKLEFAGNGLVSRGDAGVHVGFGAIGKGYAIDRVRRLLEREGFEDYLLNAGGSSLCLSGFSDAETPWTWGWSWKKRDNEPVGFRLSHPSGAKIAIGVSGTQEKGGHILCADGLSASSLESALVAHGSATRADALSTALFVGGFEKARENFSRLDEPPALAVIEKDETPVWNGLFQNLWGALASLIVTVTVRADEAIEAGDVDLESLGLDDFTPYLVERSDWWILLPVVTLLFVAIHLKDSRPLRNRRLTSQEDK